MMAGAGRYGRGLLQYFANSCERPQRGLANGIGDGIIGTGPAPFGPHEIIFPIFAEHNRSFDIVLGRDLLEGASVWKIQEPREVRFQPHNIAVRPTAVDEVILSILIAKNKWINGLSAIADLV